MKLLCPLLPSTMGFKAVLMTLAKIDSFLDNNNPTYDLPLISGTNLLLMWHLLMKKPIVLINVSQMLMRTSSTDLLFCGIATLCLVIAFTKQAALTLKTIGTFSLKNSHWNLFTSKQTFCSKMVWYNFMYHLDQQIDIHPELQAWSTEVARPHLSQIDPSFLRIDTTTQST